MTPRGSRSWPVDRMRGKITDLVEAFTGRFSDHHAFLLTKMLTRIDPLVPTWPTSTTASKTRSPLSPKRWTSSMRYPVSAPPPPG